MANEFKATQPAEYHKSFLEENLRADGRELKQFRSTIVNVGSITTADGSALVNMGSTKVICGVKVEIATPDMNHPKNGFVIVNVDLPPMCSPRFKSGAPSELAQVLTAFVDTVVRKSGCIDLEELCITEGKMVFALYCDLVCLDFNGNLLDACVLALISALKSVKLPTVDFDESGQPTVDFERRRVLRVLNTPVSTSFAVFENDIILIDPTDEEEALVPDVVTMVTVDGRQVCMVYKPGGSSLSEIQMQECLDRAHSHHDEIRRLIDETIDAVER